MRLFALEGTQVLGGAVAAALGVALDPLDEREFFDGEHHSRPLVSVRDEDVYILHSLTVTDGQSPADRFLRFLFCIGACRDNGAARITAVVPYLAFMRKEQQTKSRDPITSRYVAELLEAVGTHMVIALDVHNPAAFQNAFRCGILHLEARSLLAAKAAAMAGDRPVVFLSPDSGGMRRTHLLREAYAAGCGRDASLAMMEKHRREGELSGDLFSGEVAGADVFVVDDMIASGGTMLRAAAACRARGAAHVYAMATHCLASVSAALFTGPEFDRIVVTDSVGSPPPPAADASGKLEIVRCAPLIADAIRRLQAGRRLSPLP